MFLDLAKFCKKTGKNRGVISVTTLGFMELIEELKAPTISEIAKNRKEYQSVYAMIKKHEEWFEFLDDEEIEGRKVGRPAQRLKLSDLGRETLQMALRAYAQGLFREEIQDGQEDEYIEEAEEVRKDIPTVVVREEIQDVDMSDCEITLTVEGE